MIMNTHSGKLIVEYLAVKHKKYKITKTCIPDGKSVPTQKK